MVEVDKDTAGEHASGPAIELDHHYVFLSGHLANLQVPLPSLNMLKDNGLLDEEDFRKLELALDEALSNAVDHGNLELDSKLREEFDEQGRDRFSSLREERLSDNRFASRFVFVKVRADSQKVEVSVKDEGCGFNTDVKKTEIIESNMNLPACSGRGLILIRAASDQVLFNESGNEVIFVKKFKVA